MKRKTAFILSLALCLSSVSCPDFADFSVSYATESSDSNPMDENVSELPALKEGEARITLRDYDSGELIQFGDECGICMTTDIGYKNEKFEGGWMYTGPVYNIETNPQYCDLAQLMDADLFEVGLVGEQYNYSLPEDGKEIIKNENKSLEMIFRLKVKRNGDVNLDQKLSAQDMVLVRKWFLGDSDAVLTNWKAADFNEDGKLNITDFCMMKNELIAFTEQSETPVLLLDENRYSTESAENPYYLLVTADGSGYRKEKCDCAYDSVNDFLNSIKEEGSKSQFIKYNHISESVKEFSEKASGYKDCEMKKYDCVVFDKGQTDLYVIYKDENNETQKLLIYSYGERCEILYNMDVQLFVKTLINYGCLEGEPFWEGDNKEPVTITDIIRLSRKGSKLSVNDLMEYKCEKIGAEPTVISFVTDDEKYILNVGYEDSNNIQFATLEQVNGTKKIDIRKESAVDYFNEAITVSDEDIVLPDAKSHGNALVIIGEDIKMYSGPGREYPVVSYLYPGQALMEIGYSNNNDEWVYAEFNGKYGWVAMNDENGNANVRYDMCLDKPVIYLYL